MDSRLDAKDTKPSEAARQTLTVAEAAQVLGVGRNSAYDAVRRGDPSRVACDVVAAAGTLDVALACERVLVDGGRVPVTA